MNKWQDKSLTVSDNENVQIFSEYSIDSLVILICVCARCPPGYLQHCVVTLQYLDMWEGDHDWGFFAILIVPICFHTMAIHQQTLRPTVTMSLLQIIMWQGQATAPHHISHTARLSSELEVKQCTVLFLLQLWCIYCEV